MINQGRFALLAKGVPEYSVRAVDLVQRSTVVDMLGLLTLDYRKMSTWQEQPNSFQPSDFQRLKNSGITVFYPAVGYTTGDIYSETARDIMGWNTFLAAHPEEFLRIDAPADFERAKALGKIGILIGQQNSVHFRTLADVDCFYRVGQRISQLTYTGNRIGGGSSDVHDTGLSQYGAKVVERMNELGMAIDISHCGDRTTMDAIVASRQPVLVTHSNCRALVPAARCKTDEAIRALASKGGVMGITMVRGFVCAGGPATIENVLDHIDHVVALAGVEHVGIGSDVDLDGRDLHTVRKYDLDGMDYAKKIYDLTEGLIRRSYSNRNVEMILGGNFQRVLAEAWTPTTSSDPTGTTPRA